MTTTSSGLKEIEKREVEPTQRLEKIRELLIKDKSADVNFDKLRVLYSLIDDEIIKEHEKSLKVLDDIRLEKKLLGDLNNRRSEFQIIASILRLSRKGINKTKILYDVNMSYTQLKIYLPFLTGAGFLSMEKTGKKRGIFRTTPKGNLFLYYWTKMLQLISKKAPG